MKRCAGAEDRASGYQYSCNLLCDKFYMGTFSSLVVSFGAVVKCLREWCYWTQIEQTVRGGLLNGHAHFWTLLNSYFLGEYVRYTDGEGDAIDENSIILSLIWMH